MTQIGFPKACKFDATHGIFDGAHALRSHYDAEHANEYVPNPQSERRVTCRACGKELRRGSARTHMESFHSESRERHWLDLINDPAVTRHPAGSERIERTKLPARVTARQTPPPVVIAPFGPDNLDDIVLPVVEMLAAPGDMVPVAALGALFVWRDATAKMLRDVTKQ